MTDRLDLRRKLATVYREKEDDKKYIETLLGIISVHPNDLKTHRDLASAYQKTGNFKESAKHQRIALKIGKGTAKDYMRVAEFMRSVGLEEETVEFLDEAAYLFPEEPQFLYLSTVVLGRMERHKEAVKRFEQCEKLAKKHRPEMLNERFYFQFGSNVERDGDIDRAAVFFQKSIEMLGKKDPNPKDEKAREFTALVYNYLGYMWIENDMNIDEGGELIKSAVELDPKSGAIADSMGWYYFKKGRYEEAKKELLRAEKILEADRKLLKEQGHEVSDDTDPVILDHIGQVYQALGDTQTAIKYMERAVKGDPQKKEYQERLEEYHASVPEQPDKIR